MPFKRPGSWEGKPNYRWVKMVGGVRYRVTCAELGLPESEWTEIGSIKAAAKWMDAKVGEQPAKVERLAEQLADLDAEQAIGDIERLVHRQLLEAERRSLESLQELPPEVQATYDCLLEEQITDRFAKLRDQMVVKVDRVETVFTLSHHAANFLSFERARTNKPNTYGELADYIGKLVEMIGKESDARAVNEQTVSKVNLTLRTKYKTVATRKKVWGFFKRMVRHLWSERLIELPRNLEEPKFKFKVKPKKIKQYDLREVTIFLKELPERLKLYALLGLNCGMLGVDMASLKRGELDLKQGRIIRKRTKTEDEEDVPEVNYKLWPLTLKLLKKHLANHDSLVLTSKTNTPLWTVRLDANGKKKKKDLISLQWKRKKLPMSLKEFRSIGATIIGGETEKGYGRYAPHYLGHSPKTIADKHYVAPSIELFDKIMEYLGKTLGLV